MPISSREGNGTTNKPGMLVLVAWGYYPGRSDQMFTSLFLSIMNTEVSSAKSKPIKIIESLNIREGEVIADIGSGGGYFCTRASQESGKEGEGICG
jgi:hypothetical protein